MNSIARPTEEELDRLEELAEKYFVADRWRIDAKLWDDGDVHLTAASTVRSGDVPSAKEYSDEIWNHRQCIDYERDNSIAMYRNLIEIECDEHNGWKEKEIETREIDW